MKSLREVLVPGVLLLCLFLPLRLVAQEYTEDLDELESRVSKLERAIDDHTDGGLALFLFGAFCALWAQNTGRNAWLWFFVGLFFNVLTILILLAKNSSDRHRASLAAAGSQAPPGPVRSQQEPARDAPND